MTSSTIFDKTSASPGMEPKNHSIRFLVEVGDPSLLEIDPKKFDTSFRNPMQDHNVQLSIIYRDNSEEGSGDYVMRTFDAPSYVMPAIPIWDVCFFSYPYIIETNVMMAAPPATPDTYFNYYTKLHVFLKNRKD